MEPDYHLAQLIEATFEQRPYPGDDHIAHRYPGDPCYEGEEVWELYRGKTWREILRLGREHDSRVDPAFLSFEGFAYYLPAFLTLALDLDNPLDLAASVSFRFTFRRPAVPELMTESFSRQISTLTPAEQKVVVQVLEHLADLWGQRYPHSSNDPREALASYWDLRRHQTVEPSHPAPTVEELSRGIETVFRTSSRPPEDRIFHRAPGGIPGESVESWKAFEGRLWQDVLAICREGQVTVEPRLLTLEGFVYFLPAFLTLALEPDPSVDVEEATSFVLWAFPEPIFAMLSEEQMRVTVQALERLAVEHEARDEEGWNESWVARSRYVGEPPTRVMYDAEILIRKIEAAFAHRPRPAENALVRDRLTCLPGKVDEARNFYRGATWQDIGRRGREPDPRVTAECLSPEAFAYYLPAFLILSLDLGLPLGIRDSMMQRLWLSPEEVAAKLGQDEKECVREVLQALVEEYDRRGWFSSHHPRAALNSYWQRLQGLGVPGL